MWLRATSIHRMWVRATSSPRIWTGRLPTRRTTAPPRGAGPSRGPATAASKRRNPASLWLRATKLGTLTPRSKLAERDEAGIVEADGVEALDELAWRRRVDRERHQRLAALLRPRHGHVGDVHLRLAEHRPDAADHAGHVVVAEEDHVRRELDVDGEGECTGEEETRPAPPP